MRRYSRREVLAASTAFAAGAVFAQPLRAAAPEPAAVTPALIEAARREGKVVFYRHRGAAAVRRCLCASLVPCPRQGEAGTNAAVRVQAAASRSGRRPGA